MSDKVDLHALEVLFEQMPPEFAASVLYKAFTHCTADAYAAAIRSAPIMLKQLGDLDQEITKVRCRNGWLLGKLSTECDRVTKLEQSMEEIIDCFKVDAVRKSSWGLQASKASGIARAALPDTETASSTEPEPHPDDLPVNSMGTCLRCGYSGPGPGHSCTNPPARKEESSS